VVSGCSSNRSETSPDPTGTTASAIQGGTSDTTDNFAVGVCLGNGPGQCQGYCSGALILPNVVITARHCVSALPGKTVDCSTSPQFTGDYGAQNLFITTSSNMNQGSTGWHSVKSVTTPPDDHICGNDIAILTLKTSVGSSEATPIVPGVQYPMGDARYAQRFHAIGYGATDATGGAGVGDRRIKKSIQVLCIPGDDILDCPATAGVNPREFVGGSGTCEGDSGSSAFDTKTFGTPTATSYGVLSRGGQDGTTCVDSVYTRLDAWRDLIVNTANSASNNWTLYPKPNPDWTVFVPLPPKDGGTDGSKPPGSGAVGDACKSPKDCAGGQCIDPGDGNLICTQACDATNVCPDNFTCSDALCVPADPATTQQTTSAPPPADKGCAVSGAPSGRSQPLPWLAGLLALVALRRRRR
jgi:MYXO-CTERM domain-containing protein